MALFEILSICNGGGYKYCRTEPPHPRRNSKGLYPLHRVLVENDLGRLLISGEDVHHKDENKKNDDPSNLEVKLKAEHALEHAFERAPELVITECGFCGRPIRVNPGIYRRKMKIHTSGKLFCSRSHGALYQWSARGSANGLGGLSHKQEVNSVQF